MPSWGRSGAAPLPGTASDFPTVLGQRLRLGLGRGALGLLGAYFVGDFVVSRLGHDLFANEVGLGAIGAPFDDFLGVGVADAGEFLELVFGCGVEVD